jgi:hypothetical protein
MAKLFKANRSVISRLISKERVAADLKSSNEHHDQSF